MPPTEVPADVLVPSVRELVWPAVAVVAVVLVVVALVHLRREKQTPGPLALLWVGIVVAAPVVGPLLYLLTRRRVRLVLAEPDRPGGPAGPAEPAGPAGPAAQTAPETP